MAEGPIQVEARLTGHEAHAQATQPVAQQSPHPPLPIIPTHPFPQPPTKICTRWRKRIWGQCLDTVIKVFGILALLLSYAALCPSICEQEDEHRATQLAEWSALKDFVEHCESVILCLSPDRVVEVHVEY